MQLSVSAPGKLILIGEYAVLEGAPALVGAVDRLATITLNPNNKNHYSVTAASIDIFDAKFTISENNLVCFQGEKANWLRKRLGFFRNTFEYVWQYCKNSCPLPDTVFDVEIDTASFYSEELKTKLGFGSSAAMTVALAKALFKFAGRDIHDPINMNRLFRLSLAAHRKAQGNLGSGIDIAASTISGVMEYRVGLNNKAEQLMPEPIAIWHELPMLTIFSGSSESTRKMVTGVSDLKRKQPAVYQDLIQNLTSVSIKGCDAYRDKDINQFLFAVDEYYNQLNLLGTKSGMPIISDVHSKIADLVQSKGGVYKPSGAGSGDIGIAFCDNQDKLNAIENIIKENNFNTINCNFISL
ncbi:MAG: hypothetical protein KDF60_11525 [Calditrichaeota bacterium]|nr:hypothetical protein [Calditrichota bacterium]